MQTYYKGLIRTGLGWLCIVLGMLGLLLPIVQGIPFLVVGLYLLSRKYTWAARLFRWLRRRFPKLAMKFEEAKDKSKHLLEKILRRKIH